MEEYEHRHKKIQERFSAVVTDKPEPALSVFSSRVCALLCAAIVTLIFLSENIGIDVKRPLSTLPVPSSAAALFDGDGSHGEDDNNTYHHAISSLFTNTEAVNIFDTKLRLPKTGIKIQPDIPPLTAYITDIGINADNPAFHILSFSTATIPADNLRHIRHARAPPVIAA